jgi:sec-independent protein translocase protein TatC
MTDEFEEEQFEEKPFLEHLEDLRMTLLKIIVATIAGALVCLAVSKQIFSALTAPINRYARIVSKQDLVQASEKPASPAKAAQPQKPPSPDPPTTNTRVIVVGPFGGLVLLAHDLFTYSKEALAFLSRLSDKSAPNENVSQKERARPSVSPSPGKSKAPRSSAKKKKPPPTVTIIETGPTKGFLVVIKTAFLCGLGVTLPMNLFFLAQFVFPALTRKEKKYVTPSFLVGGVLFVFGLLFGYFLTLPLALKIFVEINARYGIQNVWKMSEYLGTATKLLIANGVVFEMPLLLIVLVRIGVLSVATLRKKRRHAIVIILFVAAMLTPMDAATMFMLAIPMVVMYEACIWVSWILMRKKRRREEEEERAESYWEERKRMREAAKVEPEEPAEKETPEAPPEEGDSGSYPDDYTEDYWYEDQGGPEEPPEEGEPGQDHPEGDYPAPDDEQPTDEDDQGPYRRDD